MDPLLHTLIATSLLLVSYKIGCHLGYSKGVYQGEAEILLMIMKALDCEKIDITEKEIKVYGKDGNGRKLSVEQD